MVDRKNDQENYLGYRKFKHLQYGKMKKNESTLKEQIDFHQKLIDAIPNPIFYKDISGVYQGCNNAFEAYLGKNRSQIIGKNVYEMFPQDLATKYYQMDCELLISVGIQKYEGNVVYGDGTRRDVIFDKAIYTNANNEIVGLVGVITDITERKKAEYDLGKSTEKLNNVLEQIVQAMAMITETRDMYTAGHQMRVAELGVAIARHMQLSETIVKSIQVAGMLHDIGKIAVPAEILTKPSKLSVHEFGIVRGHPEAGYSILKTIDFPWPIADIVYQHHERMDGSGYPKGLKNEEILIQAKIIAVADVVEAMSSHRPYRPSLGIDKAITEINLNRGIIYDDDVVKASIEVLGCGHNIFAVNNSNK